MTQSVAEAFAKHVKQNLESKLKVTQLIQTVLHPYAHERPKFELTIEGAYVTESLMRVVLITTDIPDDTHFAVYWGVDGTLLSINVYKKVELDS